MLKDVFCMLSLRFRRFFFSPLEEDVLNKVYPSHRAGSTGDVRVILVGKFYKVQYTDNEDFSCYFAQFDVKVDNWTRWITVDVSDYFKSDRYCDAIGCLLNYWKVSLDEGRRQ